MRVLLVHEPEPFLLSASSHFPWANDGLPFVARPTADPEYVVIPEGYGFDALRGPEADERTSALLAQRCSREQAADRIEAALARSPVRPFFGSAPMLAIAPLDAELRRQGSALRAELLQRRQWYDAVVAAGDRRCTVTDDLRSIALFEGEVVCAHAEFADPPHAVAALRRWIEDRCPLPAIEGAPDTVGFRRSTFAFDPD